MKQIADERAQGRESGVSPLALDGWLEFNRLKWNVRPIKIRVPGPDAEPPVAEAVLYLDKSGQVYHPRRNPYLPIRFQPTPTVLRHRLTRQWLEVAEMLVVELRQRGLKNTLTLPPEVCDIRPWQWAGFQAGIRYTYFIDLPFNVELTNKGIGTQVRKAEKLGFRCARTTNMSDVMACLRDTETRQGFSYGLSTADLELASQLLGEEHFRAYVCYAPEGQVASASVLLHQTGAPAIGWLGGTRTAYLGDGLNQLVETFIIGDIEAGGASGYDLCGANLPSIAATKANWGARLLPYYSIESYSVRRLAKWTLNWWRYLDQGRSV